VKIEREVAEAKADRSYFQIVKDVFYKHSYMYSALIITAAIGTASYLRYYHKPKHIEELQGKNIADMPIDDNAAQLQNLHINAGEDFLQIPANNQPLQADAHPNPQP
jgi:hypothetical protein